MWKLPSAVALVLAFVGPALAAEQAPMLQVDPGAGEEYLVITQEGRIVLYHESNGCASLQRVHTQAARDCGRHDRYDMLFGPDDFRVGVDDPAGTGVLLHAWT